ncbi:signal peptidase I [Phycicoccus sp. Root563]|uniref:signal peptidase I n=1 Tax=Phycicoccus sp. Root563 TaxID=1736562 RepID=UPI000A57BF47|nr:signal peptidase I [Phycicoccus sp. Root563]
MTPPSGTPDRGWLGYDRTADETARTGAETARPGAETEAAPSPWLRHEAATDPDPATGRDPAWLDPELAVPADRPDADHDTGVPPTLAEEPPTVQHSDPAGGTAPEPVPAGGEPHGEEPRRGSGSDAEASEVHGDDVEATGPRDEATGPRDEGTDVEEEAGLAAVAGAAIKEFAIVVGMALVLSFIVKTWLLQAFYIPSGSMEDTLVLNDRVIVSKLTPGPIDLKRGDIIVFADPGEWLEATPTVPHGKVVSALRETMTFVGLLPDNSENHLIKRVIGLPGDHVVCCDEGGRITVNGTAIKEPYLKPGDSASDQEFDITVPRGRVWVMGDHRSNSADSRAHDAPENDGSQGSVDERLIVGRAVALVWPLDHMTWLSNPTATFAKVPNPTAGDTSTPSNSPSSGPQGDPSSQTGGAEVTGGDGGAGG